jgi:hypothetical protein
MGDSEELKILRDSYEQALAGYEAICSVLNRCILAGTRPRTEELQREEDARAVLDVARRTYLDAWMLP